MDTIDTSFGPSGGCSVTDEQMSGDGNSDDGREHRFPLTGSEDVPRWLQACVDILGADGAVVIATPPRCPDTRRVLHSTVPTAEQVADTLYVLGAGPDAAAMTDNAPRSVSIADPDDADRWPLLIDELTARDIEWVQAYPIESGEAPIGTLQLHRRRATEPQRRSHGCEMLVAKLARVLGVLVAEQAMTSPGRMQDGAPLVTDSSDCQLRLLLGFGYSAAARPPGGVGFGAGGGGGLREVGR